MPKFSDDFADFMMQSCAVAPFVRNDGYKDVFGMAEAILALSSTKSST